MKSLKETKIDLSNATDEQKALFQQVAFACGVDCVSEFLLYDFFYINEILVMTHSHTLINGNDFFKHHRYKEIKLKDLVKPKNADLSELQAKGVKFKYKGESHECWSFLKNRRHYEVDLFSVFEEVQQEPKVGEFWKISTDGERFVLKVEIKYISDQVVLYKDEDGNEHCWSVGSIEFIEKLEGEE